MKITISIQGENGAWTERTYENVPLDQEKARWFAGDFLHRFLDDVANGTPEGESREHAIKIKVQR